MIGQRKIARLGAVAALAFVVATGCTPPVGQGGEKTTTTSSTTSTTTSTTTTTILVPPSATLTPNPVPVPVVAPIISFESVAINYTGFTPGQRLFVEQCRNFTSIGADCSHYQWLIVPSAGNPTGSGTINFAVFRGVEPEDKPWGCFAPGDTPVDGVQFNTTCYVRIAEQYEGNVVGTQLVPFSFATS